VLTKNRSNGFLRGKYPISCKIIILNSTRKHVSQSNYLGSGISHEEEQ
jgi:hypothetical protein